MLPPTPYPIPATSPQINNIFKIYWFDFNNILNPTIEINNIKVPKNSQIKLLILCLVWGVV